MHGRDAAVTARAAILNRLGTSKVTRLILELKRQLKAVEIAVANLDIAIKRLIAGDPVLAWCLDVLTSIPGIGSVAAIALIAGLHEIGAVSAKQAVMIAGLAPVVRDSGEHNGARHIRGGRAHPSRPESHGVPSGDLPYAVVAITIDHGCPAEKRAELKRCAGH